MSRSVRIRYLPIAFILLTVLSSCQSVSHESLKAQFSDLVYYSGSMDVYFEINNQEHRFRIEPDSTSFEGILNQFIAINESGEGPPETDEEKVGEWYCLEVKEKALIRVKPANKSEEC